MVRIDREEAEVVRKRKEEFYDAYSFLKLECEKNDWEKFEESEKIKLGIDNLDKTE